MRDIAILANLLVAASYTAIGTLIIVPLIQTRQVGRSNPLATATAAIFLSCAAGHFVHADHFAVAPAAFVDWHVAAVDGLTAMVGITYLTLRRTFPMLTSRQQMFPDAERDAYEARLRAAESLFRESFHGAPIGIAIVGLDGTFHDVNAAFARAVRRSPADLLRLGFDTITHPDDVAMDLENVRATLAGEIDGYQMEKRYLSPDGIEVPVLLSVSLLRDAAGVPEHFIAQIVDLTELREAVAAADAADARNVVMFDRSAVATLVLDASARVVSANDATGRVLHRQVEGGTPFADLFVAEDRQAAAEVLSSVVARQLRLDGGADGRTAQVHAARLPDEGWIVQLVDMTDLIAQQSQLREMAETDALTGLMNRRRFQAEVDQALAIAHATRTDGALLLLDLDGFKLVNDSLGHAAGDEILVTAAATMRESLPPDTVICRLGGDEFAVLVTPAAGAEQLAETLLASLRWRRRLSDLPGPVVTGSIGIAPFDATSASADDLLAEADLAMYDAKAAGRNRFAVFDPLSGLRETAGDRQRWIDRLRDPDRHLVVFGQRIVPTDATVHEERIELLIRYRDEEGEIHAPGTLLATAEESGVIGEIDRWMLRRAVDTLRQAPDCRLAVNISAQTLADPSLASYLDELGAPFSRGSLLIEITETAALATLGSLGQIVGPLRDRGCLLALDDFGSGFATFHYLQSMHVDVLKIDGRFVRTVAEDPADRLIVQSIITLAHGLGIPVVAEQVETAEAALVVQELGADFLQGHLLGVPVPLEELLSGAEERG